MDNLGFEYLDALRELGNIGVAHAATSLSELIGKSVDMNVPQVAIVKFSELHKFFNSEEIVPGVVTALEDLENGRTGYLLVAFPESEKLVSLLEQDKSIADSVLMEVGNILSSSFCNAVAEMLNIVLMPSPPNYAEEMVLTILEAIVAQIAERSDSIIVFEAELQSDVKILIVLMPDKGFMDYITKMLGMLG